MHWGYNYFTLAKAAKPFEASTFPKPKQVTRFDSRYLTQTLMQLLNICFCIEGNKY